MKMLKLADAVEIRLPWNNDYVTGTTIPAGTPSSEVAKRLAYVVAVGEREYARHPSTSERSSTMIVPTVGRSVWYRPTGEQGPILAATICKVLTPQAVNLSVCSEDGGWFGAPSVTLKQEDGERPLPPYAEWMPYQKGQAGRVDDLEAELARTDKRGTPIIERPARE
jgi:hypothetical protein